MRHADIISKWPSLSEFAADIGVEYGTAKAMRKRSSIPSKYWVTVVVKSCEHGFDGVTYEVLAKAAAHDDGGGGKTPRTDHDLMAVAS